MTDTEKDKPKFDPDFSPEHQINKKAANARGLTYKKGFYRRNDGSLARDRFGQPL